MTTTEIKKYLEENGDEKVRRHNIKNGVGENQYGVKLGDLRKLAKKIKTNHELALQLWDTGNYDVRMLAILIMDPSKLTTDELDTLVRSVNSTRVADWVNSYIVKLHPDNETLRLKWMHDSDPMAARAGWNLTKQRIVRDPEMLDMTKLLDRLENEMADASEVAQWTMNFCLVEIGINHPEHRQRALEIGENLGIYQDFPAAKGCTSPFAPIWINEMVSRQTK